MNRCLLWREKKTNMSKDSPYQIPKYCRAVIKYCISARKDIYKSIETIRLSTIIYSNLIYSKDV